MEAYYRLTDLPWSLGAEQDERFRRLVRKVAPAVLAFALVIPLLPVKEVPADATSELPPQLARFIMERRPVPPPVVQPQPVVEEPLRAEAKPTPKPVPAATPKPRSDPRERAASVGVAAFADELRDLRENVSVDRVASSGGLSSGAQAAQVERSLITAASGRASGGINTAALSRNTGGTGLAGRSTTKVAGGGMGDGGGGLAGGNGDGDGRMASRSREEIELVFDKNKAAIFALYNRALRDNPLLQGKLVLKLTIAPSGKVTHCEVVSSEIGASEFERKLVARVKMFNFGAKEVSTMTTTKPIDFFPA